MTDVSTHPTLVQADGDRPPRDVEAVAVAGALALRLDGDMGAEIREAVDVGRDGDLVEERHDERRHKGAARIEW